MNKLRKNLAISETGFIFDPSNGDSYSVNSIGIDILNLLREGKSDDVIQSEILKKYEVDKMTFENNFYDFIAMLNHYQLIENE